MEEVTVDKKRKDRKMKTKYLTNVDNLKPEFSRYPLWNMILK
jgi:hypothetical protein